VINYFYYIFIIKMQIKKTKACRGRRNACRSRRNARRRSTRRKTGGVNIGYIAPPPAPQLRVEQPGGPSFRVTYHPDYDVVYNKIKMHGLNRYRNQMQDGSYTIVGNGEYAYRILPTTEYEAQSDELQARLAELRADYPDYQYNQYNQDNQELPPPPQT
jgi:hypothetical protein